MPTDPLCCLSCRLRLPDQRGLCVGCYLALKKLVAKGRTSWARLEAAGRCLPSPRGWSTHHEKTGPSAAWKKRKRKE